MTHYQHSHLKDLEAESIHILREVMAEFTNPVMMYSVGKDSAVLLHLARKAFFPAKIPFSLLHIDTGWKFKDLIKFRDETVEKYNLDLIVHRNPDGIKQSINPFKHGSAVHTDIMKTQALKQALEAGGYDAAIGGARRDEERSRAKERIYSFRNANHGWDPKNQRPELWNIYNGKVKEGESIRVFPLSNWTELDIWQYIESEKIEVVPLYFAASRPVLKKENTLLMVDDERFPVTKKDVVEHKMVRFRTLGCYPLTAATESTATTIPELVKEILLSQLSERQGRLIDHDQAGSMEKKKSEGYF